MPSCLTEYQNLNYSDKLLNIYCLVDDLSKLLPRVVNTNRGRKSKLTQAEILTLIVFFYELGFNDWKHYHQFLRHYHSQDFNFPNYQNFIVQVNNHMTTATHLLNFLMQINKDNKNKVPTSAVDSSALPVCGNKRIFKHKVCSGVATRGVSSMGWFFGFKIHLVVDLKGNLQNIRITQATVDERIVLPSMMQGIRCMLLLADAGYISKKLRGFFYQLGCWYLTCVRSNMKKLMTWWQHELLKKRQIVEVVLSVLKYRMGMVSSLPRSVIGHMAKYVHTCFAYQIRKFLKDDNFALVRI